MRITDVTVQNYRSITQQTKFDINDLTILVGPNNEGKTNLLRAVILGMEIISRWSALPTRLKALTELDGMNAFQITRRRASSFGGSAKNPIGYSWHMDYPLAKQDTRGAHPTTIRLGFELSTEEVQKFRAETGIQNNGRLPIEIRLGRNSASLGIVKPGRGAATHRARASQIAKFISDQIRIVSIPAIRTSDDALSLVNTIASLEIRKLEQSSEYLALVDKIRALQNEILGNLSTRLSASVSNYLSTVKEIRIDAPGIETASNADSLLIDDGVITTLEAKGDGVKSLVTMAMIHELASISSVEHNLILAVDEPEAHLHPNSVHELRCLFGRLAANQQVILATHNPIFVNTNQVRSNILVTSNRARPAKSIIEVRETLGVRLADNLASAEVVVLVEGITDERLLPRLLGEVNPSWKNDEFLRRFSFKATRGVGKLRVSVQRERSTLCQIFAVVDGDTAASQEVERIVATGLLSHSAIFKLRSPSRTEIELEDLVSPSGYLHALSEHFGRTFEEKHFSRRDVKWSRKLTNAATQLGISVPDQDLIDQAKKLVVDACTLNSLDVVAPELRELVAALDRMLTGLNS